MGSARAALQCFGTETQMLTRGSALLRCSASVSVPLRKDPAAYEAICFTSVRDTKRRDKSRKVSCKRKYVAKRICQQETSGEYFGSSAESGTGIGSSGCSGFCFHHGQLAGSPLCLIRSVWACRRFSDNNVLRI